VAVDLTSLALTSLASAIGAAFAAAVGFRYGVAKFRRERAFDRRLAWYEGAIRDLVDASGKVIRAVNTVRRPALAAKSQQAWEALGEALGRLLPLQAEAEVYASNAAYQAIAQATEDVRVLSLAAETYGARAAGDVKNEPPDLKVYDTIATMLLHAASRLATDVRGELGLDPLDRELRLYDDEFIEQLEDVRKKGFADASVPRTTWPSPVVPARTGPASGPPARASGA
jgi:hypothetical protein